jgi:hypothetical protein
LFAFVSGTAAMIAALALFGGGWAAAVGFIAALVGAHVLATSVGTRLRNASREIQRWNAGRPGADPDGPPAPAASPDRAALVASPLALCDFAPRRTVVAAAVGSIAGGTMGAAAIPFIAGPQATIAGLVLGAVSCGVIGAWLVLLVANFWTIARHAWRDANGLSAGATKRSRKRRASVPRDSAA